MIPLIASVSGGKDSAAMCLHLKSLGISYRAVYMDTGWESPLTYKYIKEELDPKIGPIEVIKPDLGMAALILKKGMFPSRTIRFCTQFLKIFPFLKWVNDNYGTDPIINCVGIRAEESLARSMLSSTARMSETANQIMVWRPLLTWTERQVIDTHHEHGLLPNPLYLKGASRVGCWPCIFARKKEIRLIADIDPDRMEMIRVLEDAVTAAAEKRYEARGETFESLGYALPSFFSLKKPFMKPVLDEDGEPELDEDGAPVMVKATKNFCSPIDEVIAWSRTAHGGKQIELINSDEPGCWRWGMCE